MPDERREIQLKRPASHTTLDDVVLIPRSLVRTQAEGLRTWGGNAAILRKPHSRSSIDARQQGAVSQEGAEKRLSPWLSDKVAGAGSNPVRSIPLEDTAEGRFRVGGPVDGAWLSFGKSLIRRH